MKLRFTGTLDTGGVYVQEVDLLTKEGQNDLKELINQHQHPHISMFIVEQVIVDSPEPIEIDF